MARNMAVVYRLNLDEDIDPLYKTVVTPENFDSVMYYPEKVEKKNRSTSVNEVTTEMKPYEYFDKCIFIGCDMSKIETLKGALFNQCVFIDNDFSNCKKTVMKKRRGMPDAPPEEQEVSMLYNTSFHDCRFENNNFKGMSLLLDVQDSKFNGDNFENTSWMTRYYYADDKNWERADIEYSSFKCCNFKNAKLGMSINDTCFFNSDGPVQHTHRRDYKGRDRIVITGLDMQVEGRRSGSDFDDMRRQNENDLTTPMQIYNYSMLAGREIVQRSDFVSPNPRFVDRNIARMDKYMDLLERDEDKGYRDPWKGLEELRHWLDTTETRLEKTPAEASLGSQALMEYARKDINRDKFNIYYNQNGLIDSIERKDAAQLDLSQESFGARQRGARSL